MEYLLLKRGDDDEGYTQVGPIFRDRDDVRRHAVSEGEGDYRLAIVQNEIVVRPRVHQDPLVANVTSLRPRSKPKD